MKQLTMMVSPDGEWMLPDTPDFFAALGDPNPDYDAVSFAVKNLGFVKFQIIGQSIAEIELHPRNVELAALLAVQQQLLSSDVRLFRIKHFDTSWESEISSSVEHTVERLAELCARDSAPSANQRFTAELRDIGVVFEDYTHSFRPIAQKWRAAFQNFDTDIISLALRSRLLPKFAVVGVKPNDPDPVFRFIGAGHKWVGHNYLKDQVGGGMKVQNQPDRDYGEWVAGFYRSVANSGQPRYDVVTADLRYEDEPGKPHRRVRYERLLLPWRTPSDEVFVTLCSAQLADRELGTAETRTGLNSFVTKFANSV